MLKAGRKPLLITIGCLSAASGIIGVWVPGLPTTVFILIALWAFSQSSPRLYAKLRSLPLLSTAIQQADDYQRTKAISWPVKLIAQAFAWGSLLLAVLAGLPIYSTVTIAVLATACTIFMLKTKTK